jgi:hypothetical protein
VSDKKAIVWENDEKKRRSSMDAVVRAKGRSVQRVKRKLNEVTDNYVEP